MPKANDPGDLRAHAAMLDKMAGLFSDEAASERTRTLAERYRRTADRIENEHLKP